MDIQISNHINIHYIKPKPGLGLKKLTSQKSSKSYYIHMISAPEIYGIFHPKVWGKDFPPIHRSAKALFSHASRGPSIARRTTTEIPRFFHQKLGQQDTNTEKKRGPIFGFRFSRVVFFGVANDTLYIYIYGICCFFGGGCISMCFVTSLHVSL